MKTKKKKLKIALGLTIGLFAIGGGALYAYYLDLIAYPVGIHKPLGHQIDFVNQNFDSESEFIFRQPTGTEIIIPANALEYQDGSTVKGNATLKFREYHTAHDIFLSGIPMQFGENREKMFSSGGMFELRAEKDGKKLKLKKGERIGVKLANYTNSGKEDFEIFELENDKTWGKGSDFELIENEQRKVTLEKAKNSPPPPSNPNGDSTDFIFSFTADKLFKHLQAWKKTEWKLIDYKGEIPVDQALRIDWDDLKIKQLSEKEFELNLTVKKYKRNGEEITYNSKIIAEPLLSGKKLELALKNYEKGLKKYSETIAKINQEAERAAKQAALLSSFEILQFGIYNCDKLINSDQILATVQMEFDFEKELNPLINRVNAFLILEEDNGVITYNSSDWDKLPILKSTCSMAFVLPDGNVAFVESTTYKTFQNSYSKRYFKVKTKRMKYNDFLDFIKPKQKRLELETRQA
jgi:hypothetical protein